MGATDAARQRRYRAHKAGNHELCDPARRCDVTGSVTQPATRVPAGPRLLATGRRLWDELDGEQSTGQRRVLVLEACRIADRLAQLDRILSGDARDWLDLVEDKAADGVVEVVITKPLAEARQQATALARLTAELRQGANAEKPATGGSILDQLAAKRAQRLADTAG